MKWIWRFCSLSMLVLASSSAVVAEPDSSPEVAPNVLLVTVDTLRPDALGWVAGLNPTPEIDRLAQEGLRFPDAVAPIPITLPSHTSILSGLIPRRHGVRDNGQVVPGAVTTLAERLRAEGYATAAFVSGYPLASHFGLDQGFETFDDGEMGQGSSNERVAAETTAAALEWLEASKREGPWFLWVHYYDPHDPYTPPSGFEREGVQGDYWGEVAAVDAAFGRLRDGVRNSVSDGSLLTLFTADHGESLGEHGEETHGFFLYRSTTAVPMVVHWPGVVAPGEAGRRGALVDLYPTVLDLLDLPSRPGLDGVSLVAGESGQPAIYLESRRPWYSYGWSPLRAVIQDGWKLVVAPRPELYDLETDPEEATNRVDDARRKARSLQAALREIETLPSFEAAAVEDAETTARLAALGYIGGGQDTAEIPASGLADPKDRIELWNQLGEAEALRESGRVEAASAAFDRVLEVEPKNPFALSRSGALLAASEVASVVEQGIGRLEMAVQLVAGDAEAWSTLAGARGRLGLWDASAEAWQQVVRLRPRQASGWVGLANAKGLAGRPQDAVAAFERLVELEPDSGDAYLRLAFARVASDDLTGAAADLERAAERLGGEFQHAGALGVLLLRSGQAERAVPWLRRSQPAETDFVTARVLLARLHSAAGDESEARRSLLEAVAVRPALRQELAGDPELDRLLP